MKFGLALKAMKEGKKVKNFQSGKDIGFGIMKLNETIQMMDSADYKDRFKAEYLQLKIRIEGLSAMLKKYKAGTLTFKPTCSYELLHTQLVYMECYKNVLEERAKVENIEL